MPDDMTVEVDRQSSGVTEARSLLAPKSLLAQTVETQLLPEERFKSQLAGHVQEIRKIDEVVGILTEIEDHYEALLFDGNGNLLRLHLDPSSRDIAAQSKMSYISVESDVASHTEKFNETLNKLGFNQPEVQARIKSDWEKSAKTRISSNVGYQYGYMVEKNRVQNEAEFFIPAGKWDLDIREDPATGKKGFVFHTGDAYFYIDPSKPDNRKPLTPEQVNTLNNPAAKLTGDLALEEDAHFFKINDKNGRELASFSGSKPRVDPNDSSKLYFINTGRIYSLDLNGVANRNSKPVPESQIRIENPQEIDVDPNVNFLIIRSEDNKLSIVDKESGDVVKEFGDVTGPILVDQQGDILYVDTQNKLREVQTNFQAIPAGGSESAQQKREEELKALQERFSALELKKVERQRGGQISEDDVANTLRGQLARQVDQPLAEANNPEAIEDLMDRLQGLKADPANQGYGEVVDEFITRAREKLSGIRTTELTSQLEAYGKSLDGVQSVGDTIGLDEQFARLLDLRQKTDITDPNIRRSIEQQLRTIQTRKEAIVGQYQGELLTAINDSIPAIEQLIKETGSTQELAMFGTGVEAQQFEMMLANIRDPQVRRELRDRINAVKVEQRTGLEARGRQLEDEQRLRWAQAIEEAKEDLASLQDQVAQLADVREIDRFERNPLVTAWRAKIFALPPELREIEEKKLEVIMGSRKKDIQHRRELGAVGEVGELKFGDTSFPVYREPPRIWQPRLLPIKGAMPGYADLAFEDEQGRVWHPDPEHRTVVIADMNYEQTARMVERYRKEAEDYFKGLRRDVPDYDEHWKITEGKMGELAQVAESFNLQLDNHMGLTILEGEAGTGKNVDIDMIANLSNREVVTIACNERTEKEDLTYEFYYDPERGTYKLPSKLIDALKRPGVIILFDEINTVKPGIVKMLNPLFDYRRKLVINEGGVEQEIIADPTVILAGTMNPQDYAGVDRLAETILSRADILEVDYPPFEVPVGGRTRYRSDEAEMLYAYMHGLNGLQQKEFKLVWDAVINRDASNGADVYLQGTPGLENDVRRLYDAIRVADRLRRMYKAYQVGESNEPMDFTTSIREMVNIALRMNHNADVKQVVKRVILPKIGDRRQRVMVDQTINAVLPT